MAVKKVSALTVATTMAAGDKVPFVSTPGGTPADKIITKENLFRYLALGSDADGDMYYRQSSLLARLAKGAANTKLFMNAGATAPAWHQGIVSGVLTRAMDAATANVATTGLGFKPSAILFSGAKVSSLIGSYFGFAVLETTHFVMAGWPGVTNYYASGSYCIMLAEATDKYQTATVASFDADGFTLAWTRNGATAGGNATIGYIAFR
jgi:hypothetical protein